MSECFAAIQQEDSAYVYLNKYEQYKDSLDQVNSLAEIRRMESRAGHRETGTRIAAGGRKRQVPVRFDSCRLCIHTLYCLIDLLYILEKE